MPKLLYLATVPQTFRALRLQMQTMQQRGYQVHAAASDGDWPWQLNEAGESACGVQTHVLEMTRRITPLRDLIALVKMIRLLRRVRPDLVHAHTPKAGLLGMTAGALTGVSARVYHVRGLRFETSRGLKRRLLRFIEQTCCGLAHKVLSVGRAIRRVAIQEGVVRSEKIVVPHRGGHGLDAAGYFNPEMHGHEARKQTREAHGIAEGDMVLGFVGRVVRDKGVAELADAWRVLREAFPTLHLLIVGPFEGEDRVPDKVRQMLTADDRVHLAGTNWETGPLYAAMDVVCLPSYREGLPKVPLEAAAMQLPVVASNIPGCDEAVIDGRTGMLVPPRDATALAGAIAKYLQQDDLRTKHGSAGRKRVLREFAPQAVAHAVCDIYDQLLKQNGRDEQTGQEKPPAELPEHPRKAA